MRAENRKANRKQLAYIWLIPGIILYVLGNGNNAVPIASWLFSIFLIRFTRSQKPLKGFAILAPLIGSASIYSFWGTAAPQPDLFLNILPGVLGGLLSLVFLADRLLSVSIKGYASTLVFPLAYTSFDFILARFNPMGSTGVLAYSQYPNLPLIQIVAITGLWGLTFLITWFSSVVNWIWENNFNWQIVRKGSLVYSLIVIVVLLYGGGRLALAETTSETVHTAGLYVYDLRADSHEIWDKAANDRDAYRKWSREIQDRLFEQTIKSADFGAQIIVWSEISPFIAGEDMDQFMIRARQISNLYNIYLAVSPYVDFKEADRADENVMIIFSPQGEEVYSHYKFGGSIFEGTLAGDAVLRAKDTEFGRVSGVICWDQDFPHIMRQAGKNNTDIMLAPNADWPAITPMHTHIGIFRAIENGYSLVRPNVNGLSVITDPYGRVLAANEHVNNGEWTISAHVPVRGISTVYTFIGDIFGWLALIVLGLWTLFCLRFRHV